MDQLNNNKMKKAAQSQKSAAKKMKDLAEKMQSMMMQGEMEELEIDAEKLRRILENVLYVSFEQEKLMNEFTNMNSYDPHYVELAQRQGRLKEISRMIEDSLFSLSKELPMISSMVNKEIGDINFQYDKLNRLLTDRNVSEVRVKQQYILTSTNNLALLLSEVLKSLKDVSENTQAKGMGKKKCKPKQGGKGSGISNLRQLQEELNKQIEQLKQGSNPMGNNPNLSKELAKIAQQQEMLRNALRKISDEQNKQGNDKMLEELNKIQKMMEKTEEELVNKKITPEMINRQKEITVKLLEAEKAEMKQDYEEKRQSKTAREIFNPNPPSLEQYKRMKLKEVELLQTVPPTLNGFYRMKVKEYFNQIR